MTNYEKNKEIIDLMLQRGEHIALNKNTKEIVPCIKLDCEDCLFSRRYNWPYDCTLNRTKWLVEEYTKAEVDWSKVSVDTAVLVSNNGEKWYRRYFASVDDEGKPLVFPDGRTSWSNARCSRMWTSYKYIELAEVE
jgi:hypothetical protein